MVQQLQLKGHQAPVLSLAHSGTSHATNSKRPKQQSNANSNATANQQSHPCCLLSGSQDGTTRLWDLRSSSRAALCILAPLTCEVKDVTAVGFHPIMGNRFKEEGRDLTLGSCGHDFTIYTAVGSDVYGYDLRNINSPIIRQHDFHLNCLTGRDEINQLSFGELNKNIYMAVGDDDGQVRITNTVPNQTTISRSTSTSTASASCPTTLTHNPEASSALVTSVAFRPRTKQLDIATAGTDCSICLWDVTRPRRPSSIFQVPRDDAEGGSNQVCNPPIVHSISWSPSGRLLASGLGDGSALVMRVEGRRLVEACRLQGGHESAVATILFPHFNEAAKISSHVAADDRLMVSGGNDGAIYLWDLGVDVAGDAAVDPSTLFQGCSSSNATSSDVNTALSGLTLSTEPRILFGIPHEKKLNFIVSSKATEPVLPTTLFVADTSNDITAYMLPTV